jgi:nitronate monooxygenase
VNRFMTSFEPADAAETTLPSASEWFDSLGAAAIKHERAAFLSLWAGPGVRMARRQSAADLVARRVRAITRLLALQDEDYEHR